ncbi:MAG: M23 family metallopeptidase [Phototrophicaceae bacterium]
MLKNPLAKSSLLLVMVWALLLGTLSLVMAQDIPTPETPAGDVIEPTLAQPDDPETTAEAGAEIAAPAPRQKPEPSLRLTAEDITLEHYFDQVQQGRAALLRVTGDDLAGARLRFMDQLVEFFPADDGSYYGLLVVDMDRTHNRALSFDVIAWRDDGSRVTLSSQVEVTLGGFVRQDFNLPAERSYLADPQVERNEFARLDAIFADVTPERMWDSDGFIYPINSPVTSPFGAYRIINETMPTRHTGWDLRAAVGTPVRAMGSGRVAFASLMDIRGNHVIIDHGYGIYSGYSHLSQVHVTRGQTVSTGQIIGVSGNTGRSSGPHLHWEVTINGHWVDSLDFVEMWLP